MCGVLVDEVGGETDRDDSICYKFLVGFQEAAECEEAMKVMYDDQFSVGHLVLHEFDRYVGGHCAEAGAGVTLGSGALAVVTVCEMVVEGTLLRPFRDSRCRGGAKEDAPCTRVGRLANETERADGLVVKVVEDETS